MSDNYTTINHDLQMYVEAAVMIDSNFQHRLSNFERKFGASRDLGNYSKILKSMTRNVGVLANLDINNLPQANKCVLFSEGHRKVMQQEIIGIDIYLDLLKQFPEYRTAETKGLDRFFTDIPIHGAAGCLNYVLESDNRLRDSGNDLQAIARLYSTN